MSTENVIIAFLRKESLTNNEVRSNGEKLFIDNTCIGQWSNHRVIMNDTFYDEKSKKIQIKLYKWLVKSFIIFKVIDNVTKNTKDLL